MGTATGSLYDRPREDRTIDDLTGGDDLVALGWDDETARAWAAGAVDDLVPARVARTDRGEVTVLVAPATPVRATTTTAARDTVAGDWVGVSPDRARVERLLPRRSAFVRRAARGARRAQTLAANMDVVGVVQACAPGIGARRLERELTLAHQSRARPLVVVTKTDLVGDPGPVLAEAARLAPGVEVVGVSNVTGEGIEPLRRLLPRHSTVALLGASGVGKSALVNRLADADLRLEGAVRRGDAKGRHTTTAAELIPLGDLLVIDTPGVRALAVWDVEAGLPRAFPEIAEAAARCRFDDCGHTNEPGCAVLAAVDAGRLDPERLEHWRRLAAEAAAR